MAILSVTVDVRGLASRIVPSGLPYLCLDHGGPGDAEIVWMLKVVRSRCPSIGFAGRRGG